MLPTRWLGWTSDLAGVVAWPLTPFTDAGTKLTAWLRPATSPLAAYAEDDRDLMERLATDKEIAEAQLARAQLKIVQLEEQIAQLQLAKRFSSDRPVRYMLADVTKHSPNLSADVVSINRGERDNVRVGSVAVYAGVHLIGQVSEVGHLESLLTPITSPAMRDLVEAIIMPRDDPDAPATSAARVQLSGKDGVFTAEVDRQMIVERGDIARLADARWPGAAQAMIIGIVEAVESIDDQPLRKRIVIRPKYRAQELANVTLKVEIVDSDERGTP